MPTAIKIRLMLLARGFDIAFMGIELMVKGLIAPTWALHSGFSMESKGPGKITVIYDRPKTDN